MKIKHKILLLVAICTVLVALYLFLGLNERTWEYALVRRIPKVIAFLLTGSAIAFSTVIFQTVTNNRILTPSIIGLDSLYVFLQTALVYFFGSVAITLMGDKFNFLIAVALMSLFSILLFKLLFKEGRNIYFILLVGIVIGTLFQSMSTFMQVLIDPNEFLVVQNNMFASFNNINIGILWLALGGTIGAFVFTYPYLNSLDVLSLGRENAINLGVSYDKVVQRILIIVGVLISISTALVGPITFLGLLVANLAKEFLPTYKHKILILGAMLISCIALVGGQLIVERIFTFSTPISVIINFVGGVYFIYLLLKGSKL